MADKNFILIESPLGKMWVFEPEFRRGFRRVYFISSVPESERRGFHAHKELTQVAFCVSGSCKILLNNGLGEESTHHLGALTDPLWIRPLVWHELFNFSQDCILAVLAEDKYDEQDYIRNWSEFKEIVLQRGKQC